MELGSLTISKYFEVEFKQKKGMKKYPREILYLRWISDKVRLLNKDIEEASREIAYEDVFVGDKVKDLTSIFKNFLNMKKNFTNFNNIDIKLSYVEKLIELRYELYYLISEKLGFDLAIDDIFQDFFEEFIMFTRRINLKKIEDYEYDILRDSDSDSDSENENEDLIIFSSDSD